MIMTTTPTTEGHRIKEYRGSIMMDHCSRVVSRRTE